MTGRVPISQNLNRSQIILTGIRETSFEFPGTLGLA